MTLRPADDGDGEVVTSLLSEFGAPRTPPPERMDAVLRTFDDHLRRVERGEARLIVAEQDGVAVGVCSLEWRAPFWTAETHAWLPDLVVTESARGRGIGRALLADAMAAAAMRTEQRSCPWNRAGRGRRPIDLYRSCGFSRDGTDLPTAAGRTVSDYLRRLPIGQRVSTAPVTGNELWPFDADLETVALEEPRIPEPPRGGAGGVDCSSCRRTPGFDVWQDGSWALGIPEQPSGLPILAVLISRAHHDLEDLPPDLAAELGPMIQRVARAIGSVEDVGRVHVNRWGDGGEHFHVWFLARPRGHVAAARRAAGRLGRPPAQGAAGGVGSKPPGRGGRDGRRRGRRCCWAASLVRTYSSSPSRGAWTHHSANSRTRSSSAKRSSQMLA